MNKFKDEKYIHTFKDYVVVSLIRKYKEIKKYSEIRINTLDLLADEIEVKPEIQEQLEFTFSVIKKLKEILMSYQSYKK